MHCSHCKRKLPQGSKFCNYCGAEQPAAVPAPPTPQPSTAAPKNFRCRYWLFGSGGTAVGAILLAVILLIAGVFSAGGKTIEGPGYSTPEEAAEAYLTALRDQDVDAMVAAFAVESYAANYDFEAMVERINSYNINLDMPFPNTNDYTRQMNAERRRDGIVSQIIFQYMLYNAPDALNNGAAVTFDDSDALSDFAKGFERDTEDYIFDDLVITASLSTENIAEDTSWEDLPEDILEDIPEESLDRLLALYLSDANQENIERLAEIFGVEDGDVVNVAVFFEADGDTWVFFPQVIQYDGRWYLQVLQGNLAIFCGMSYYSGGIMPIDMDYFE